MFISVHTLYLFFGIPTIECYPYNIDNLTEFKNQRTNFSFYQPSNSNINLKDHSFKLKDYTTINLTPSCPFLQNHKVLLFNIVKI